MSNFAAFFAAASAGAAAVYHRVLNTGLAITAWEAAHPAIAPLIGEGVDVANGMLERAGVPIGVLIGAEDVLTALKGHAIADATVPSLPSMTTSTTTTTSTESTAQAIGQPF